MRDKRIERRLRSAAKKDTPDLKDEIKASSTYQDHMEEAHQKRIPKRAPSFGLRYVYAATVVVLLLVVAFLLPFGEDIETSVYLDINPGIRLDLDGDDVVKGLAPTNDDGEQFLQTIADTRGFTLDDAIDQIVDEAIGQGFLSDETPFIVYDVVGEDESHRGRVLGKLEERLPEAAQGRVEGFAIMRGVAGDETPEEAARARDHGMSVMRLRLVEHIFAETDDFDFDDLQDLPVQDLREIMEDKGIPEPHPGPPDGVPGPPDGAGPPW